MKKTKIFTSQTDVQNIECSLQSCRLILTPTDEEFVSVEYTDGANLHIASNQTDLIIKRREKLREKLFELKTDLLVNIPERKVVNLALSGERAEVILDGGVYGDTEISSGDVILRLDGARTENLTINGGTIEMTAANSIVKGNITVAIVNGNVTLENCSAGHIACRMKHGNAGAVNLDCGDSLFEICEGNINATVLGDEKTFEAVLTAKDGTCNRESVNIEGKKGAFRAFAERGNIHVDFVENQKEAEI